MSDLDNLFTITCGKCGKTEPFHKWCVEHDAALFICPACSYTFRRERKIYRKPWEKYVELVEVK